jgi:membrane-associated phospholipid phosphatase
MLSLTSVLVVWRWARRWLPVVLAIAVPLIASTVVLRYHWPVDVVAGALLCWPVARLCDGLLDRDGAEAPEAVDFRLARRGAMP